MCDNYEYIYEIKDILINQGITTNICYIEKGMKQKMKYANKLKTKYVVIIGEDEVSSNTIVLKNMYEGIQFNLTREELNSVKQTYF
jgi:histidyl-tRNA synthetase